MTEPSELGATLKRLRTAKSLSQRALATAAGIPSATISMLEGGIQQSADVVKLRKLATALGCALSELAGEEAAPPADGDGRWSKVRLIDIKPSPLNPRKTFDPEALAGLAASIEAQGLLQNLVLRAGDEDCPFQIVAGERRYRALLLLAEKGAWNPEEPNIPANIVDGDDAKHLAIALLENLQRHDVNPMEEAEGFAQLIALDPSAWSTKSIAESIGCTPRHIQQRLALLDKLADEAQTALRKGAITFSQARVLTMAPLAEQADLVKKADKLPPAPQLRSQLTGNLVPVKRAIFDLSTYDGVIVETDNGTRYFRDKQAFLAAQRAAAEQRVEELAQSWAWAKLYDGFSFNWTANSEHEPCDDRARAGCLVHFNKWEGKVEVREGLVPRKKEVDEQAAKERYAAQQAAKQAMEKEASEFRLLLGRAIIADPGAALLLLLVDRLRPDAGAGHLLYVDHWRGLTSSVFSPGAPLECLADLVEPQQSGEDRTRALKDNGRSADAWARLVRQPDVNIRMAVEGWIASRICVHVSDSKFLHPVLVALARKYRIAIPPCFDLGDQSDLEDAVAAAPAPALSAEQGGQGERDEEEGSPVAVIRSASIRLPQALLSALGQAIPRHEDYGAAEMVLYGPEDTDDGVLLDASSHDDEYYIIGLVNNFALGKEEEARRVDAVLRHWITSVAPELLPADANPVREEAA